MVKNYNKEKSIIFLCLVIVIILLLVNTVCAHSYFISDSLVNTNKKINKKEKDILLDNSLKLLVSFFSIKQIGIVSADEEENDIGKAYAELMGYNEPNYGNFQVSRVNESESSGNLEIYCCKEKITGGICEDIFAGSIESVKEVCKKENILAPTKCEETVDCSLGCCIYENGEICTPKSPKWKCEADGGVFNGDAMCDAVSVCEKGCCIFGSNGKLATKAECEAMSLERGIEVNYNPGVGELACIYYAENTDLKEGACVIENLYEENSCQRTTKAECDSLFGHFYQGLLCTNNKLETNCESTGETLCIEDGARDGVYYIDSCGNIANIYDADKRNNKDYWNKIYSRSESCNPSESNADSSFCGNCKLELGSICGKDEKEKALFGNYICQDLTCHDAPSLISPLGEVLETQDRRNGESWCLYDSSVGVEDSPYGNSVSTDTVGSLHWLATCKNGEFTINHCGDYRSGICVEDEIKSPDNSQVFSSAQCLINQAPECLMFNVEASDKCEQDADCKEDYFEKHCTLENTCDIRNIRLGDKHYFSMCVPRYPSGFDLRTLTPEANEMFCDLASQECTVVYVTEADGDNECEVNCNCEESSFSEQLNDLGVSLGDCGSYVNYLGKGTDNSKAKGDTIGNAIDSKDYSYFSSSIKDKVVEPYISASKIKQAFLGESFSSGDLNKGSESLDQFMNGIQGASGIAGLALYGELFYMGTAATVGTVDSLTGLPITLGESATAPSFMGGFTAALVGAGVGAMVGSFIADYIGAEGQGSQAIVYACALAGAFVGVIALTSYTWSGSVTILGWATGLSATGIGAIVAIVIAIIVIAWVSISGWGDVEEKYARFENNPWKAPTGGDDCHYCNEDKLGRPCTEYRCHSLGQACYLINNGVTDKPECVAMEDDGNYPMITPLKIINTNYEFANETSSVSGGGSVTIQSNKSDDEGRKCINNFERISFILETDEYAQCRYSFELPETAEFKDMPETLEGGASLINHTFDLSFESIALLKQKLGEDFSEEMRRKYSDMRIYIRCQDNFGYSNLDSYMINFCIYEDDETAVNFNEVQFNPIDEGYLQYNTINKSVKMWLPEPAKCRYSESDKDYSEMENNMNCDINYMPSSANGWLCDFDLKNLNTDTNKYYIRCNDTSGNLNTQGFEYVLYGTESPLEIESAVFSTTVEGITTSVNAGETMNIGISPASVEMIIKTSGGVNNGDAICKWQIKGFNEIFFKSDIGSDVDSIHTQMLNTQLQGNHSYLIKCYDNGNNLAEKNISYILKQDNNAPGISRIYHSGGSLKLQTSEYADCYVNNQSNCNFNINSNSVEKMTKSGTGKEHSISWIPGKEYYIKCFDKWDNPPVSCSAIIHAEDDLESSNNL